MTLSLISIPFPLLNQHQPQLNKQLIYFLQCQQRQFLLQPHLRHHQVLTDSSSRTGTVEHWQINNIISGAGFDLLGAMSPTTPATTASPMQPMTSTTPATSTNQNRSVGTTWANGNTGKVNIDLANLGKPVQQKKSASMNELKSQMPSSGNPGMCSIVLCTGFVMKNDAHFVFYETWPSVGNFSWIDREVNFWLESFSNCSLFQPTLIRT